MKTEWAFLAGLGVGTVATLMLAPHSGKDTQELLAGKLRGGLDQVASAGKKVRAGEPLWRVRRSATITQELLSLLNRT